jgi:hypothetical protein
MAIKKPLVIDSTGAFQLLQTGDFIDITMGGTGAVDTATARTNLGLSIGVAVQAWGASLDAIQALNTTGYLVRTGVNTYAARNLIQPSAGITITNSDGIAGDPTFSLNSDLAALEGLSGTGIAVRSASNTWVQRSLTASARVTITNPDGVAGNPTFDLATVTNGGGGTLQKITQDTYGRVTNSSAVVAGDLTPLLNSVYLSLSGGTMTGNITLFADPTQALHPVTKQYADAIAAGLVPKPSVKYLASTNINIANPGTSTFDGVVASAGDRILLTGQTNAAQNGPYIFNGSSAALTLPTDWDSSAEIVAGATFYVTNGASFSNSTWSLTTSGPYTLGTTNLSFTQTNGLGDVTVGNGLTKTGNQLSLNTTARFSYNAGSLDLATGIVTAGTYTKLTVDTYGRVTAGTTATPSDIGAQPVSPELTGLAAVATNGTITRTAAGTYVARTLVAPSAGISITNPDGVAGNPTFGLTGDLAAILALAGTGFAVRTAANTWAQRTLLVQPRLTITNADGVAGNPTLDLASGIVAPGTYQSVTVDTYGRVTAGSTTSANAASLTNGEAGSVNPGAPVYISGGNTFKMGIANAAAQSLIAGLNTAAVASGAVGIIKTADLLTQTTAQWDTVTGQSGGLTVGAIYFVNNTTAGMLTSTVPSSGYIASVGEAISSTAMLIRITPRIQL